MTHRVFPHIPAGVPLKDADSSHAASGSFSRATEQPPGRRAETMTSRTTVTRYKKKKNHNKGICWTWIC